jgi:hypothetical protein
MPLAPHPRSVSGGGVGSGVLGPGLTCERLTPLRLSCAWIVGRVPGLFPAPTVGVPICLTFARGRGSQDGPPAVRATPQREKGMA